MVDDNKKLFSDLVNYFLPVFFKFFISFVVIDYFKIHSKDINILIACSYSFLSACVVIPYFLLRRIDEKTLYFCILMVDLGFILAIYRPDLYPEMLGINTVTMLLYYIHAKLKIRDLKSRIMVLVMMMVNVFLDAILSINIYFFVCKIALLIAVVWSLESGSDKRT